MRYRLGRRARVLLARLGLGPTYRTESGRVLTDEDVYALADEAEKGYEVKP